MEVCAQPSSATSLLASLLSSPRRLPYPRPELGRPYPRLAPRRSREHDDAEVAGERTTIAAVSSLVWLTASAQASVESEARHELEGRPEKRRRTDGRATERLEPRSSSSRTRRTTLTSLPVELVQAIAHDLPLKDRFRLRRVCSSLRDLMDEPSSHQTLSLPHPLPCALHPHLPLLLSGARTLSVARQPRESLQQYIVPLLTPVAARLTSLDASLSGITDVELASLFFAPQDKDEQGRTGAGVRELSLRGCARVRDLSFLATQLRSWSRLEHLDLAWAGVRALPLADEALAQAKLARQQQREQQRRRGRCDDETKTEDEAVFLGSDDSGFMDGLLPSLAETYEECETPADDDDDDDGVTLCAQTFLPSLRTLSLSALSISPAHARDFLSALPANLETLDLSHALLSAHTLERIARLPRSLHAGDHEARRSRPVLSVNIAGNDTLTWTEVRTLVLQSERRRRRSSSSSSSCPDDMVEFHFDGVPARELAFWPSDILQGGEQQQLHDAAAAAAALFTLDDDAFATDQQQQQPYTLATTAPQLMARGSTASTPRTRPLLLESDDAADVLAYIRHVTGGGSL